MLENVGLGRMLLETLRRMSLFIKTYIVLSNSVSCN